MWRPKQLVQRTCVEKPFAGVAPEELASFAASALASVLLVASYLSWKNRPHDAIDVKALETLL